MSSAHTPGPAFVQPSFAGSGDRFDSEPLLIPAVSHQAAEDSTFAPSQLLPPPPAYGDPYGGDTKDDSDTYQASSNVRLTKKEVTQSFCGNVNTDEHQQLECEVPPSSTFKMGPGPLTRPFAVPQTGAGGAAPFLRGFSVALAELGIKQDDFIGFIDQLNETVVPNPELHVAEKAAKIAGFIVPNVIGGVIPGFYGLYAGLSIMGLQIAAVVGGVAQVKGATKKFLKITNKEFFLSHGVEALLIPAKDFNEKAGFEDDFLAKKRGDLKQERKAFKAERKAIRKARKAARGEEKQQRKIEKQTVKWEKKQLKRESKGKPREDIDNLSISSASSGSSSSSADSSDDEAIARQQEHMDPIARIDKYGNVLAPLSVSLPPLDNRTSAGRTDAMARYGARSVNKGQAKVERKAAKAALKGKMKKTQNVEKGVLWLVIVNKEGATPKANYSADAPEEDEYDDEKEEEIPPV